MTTFRATGGIPQVYPELLGKDYKQRIVNGLNAAKQAGINTIVDADTFDLGRAVKILAEVSQISGSEYYLLQRLVPGITYLSRQLYRRPVRSNLLPVKSGKASKVQISKQAFSNPPQILGV